MKKNVKYLSLLGAIASIIGLAYAIFSDSSNESMSMRSDGSNNTFTSNQIDTNTGNINIVSSNPDESLSGEFPIPKIYGLSYDDARVNLNP